jgi:hypothetical protein
MDETLDALGKSRFRAKFHLTGTERAMVMVKGRGLIRQHAADLIGKRLAPAHPSNDGKQTPFKGHPVFIAQHATATCCRGCLQKWHKIPKGRELTKSEQEYIVNLIDAWIRRELF